jgi:hypothetical protein
MKKILCTFALLFLPLAAQAQKPMSGAEFQSYVTGKTLYFGESGQPYGAEQYLKDRRVRWSFLDGKCKNGLWYEQDSQICFVYEDNPDPQCWSFYREGDGLRAVFENDPANTVLYEANQSPDPMLCLGPDVGV